MTPNIRPRMHERFNRDAGKRWPRPLTLAVALALAAPLQAQSASPGLRDQADARIFSHWASSAVGGSADLADAATAQTRLVANCADAGVGSLRDTLAIAGDGDTLDLSGLPCATIHLQTGVLLVGADDIHLLGPGAEQLAIDGGGKDRVLIDPNGTLTISGLSIRNGVNRTSGFHVAGGGCIAAAGELKLLDSVVSGCLAAGEGAYGGALYAFALTMRASTISDSTAYGVLPGTGTAANGGAAFVYEVDIVDSTISSNTATHRPDPSSTSYDVGGGIMVVRGGRISASTFDHNRAEDRGGAINSLNGLAIANSTIADNVVTHGRGGAIYMRSAAQLALNNVTISGNRGGEGGGLHLSSGGAHIESSIIQGNQASMVPGSSNFSATVPVSLTGSHNLIGPGRGAVTAPADTLNADARLLPLAFNGGPTHTMALSQGSPAVDAGSNPLGAPFDQRGDGYPRVLGSAADIGAYERAPLSYAPVPGLSARMVALLSLLLAAVAAFSFGVTRGRDGVTIER